MTDGAGGRSRRPSPVAPDGPARSAAKWERRRVKLLPWFYCPACGDRLSLREFAARWYTNGLDDACFEAVVRGG